MRNITLSDFERRLLHDLEDCEAFCHDRQFIYACAKGKILKCRGDTVEVIVNLCENLYPVSSEDCPKAVEISYSLEKDSLYLILYNGDIISLALHEAGLEDVVGSVDGGIKAAQWSPNEEVIALVTGNDSVILMTQDFDPVSEVELHSRDFGEKQFVTVGWGKKETQFHGSEGKFNAKNKKEENEISNKSIDTVKISWRGDAEYFAVSCVNPKTLKRYLRIYNKSGILQYTSEDLNGLEHTLNWSSAGNLIASTQMLPNKYVVCFFEKNGLKHGEFKLPFPSTEIKVDEVLWNTDSKILALLILKTCDKSKYIQLYTISNYCWYCKYTINFNSSVPILMKWDTYKPNTLNVIVKENKNIYINKYVWLWVTNKSKGTSLYSEALVAVVDGCNLKITAFNRAIVPPPMCTYQIQMADCINSVCFAPDVLGVSSNDLMVHLANGTFLFYKFIDKNKAIKYELLCEIKSDSDLEFCYNATWVGISKLLLCVIKLGKESKPFLRILNIENIENSNDIKTKDLPLQSTISLIKSSLSDVLIYTNDLKLYTYFTTNNELEFLASVNKNLIALELKQKKNGGFYYFSLDFLNKFSVNNSVALNNVLSFHVHENFILLTTMKHELLCVNAEGEINADLSETSSRRVERGSRLVTSVLKDSKVILQMPRGNLECVQPRTLSLFVVGKYLDDLKYFDAFDLMRKQRINLNLLYDHNPGLFSDNINVFFEQIKDLQWVSLFLSDLSEEDVTQTMYSIIYKNKNIIKPVGSKINRVCELVEKALTEKENSDQYLLPVLMSYIKRGKLELLETALLKLKQLKNKEQNSEKHSLSFDEALKYILYMIDVDELYKVALGMYDFDLVLIIASKSQKDPKEYLEFLNELNQLEPNYQKYKIDKYLKRNKKALANLVKCEGDDIFRECINFIKTNKLYKHALKLIPENTDRYKNICMCYGDELLKNQFYDEAGFMYLNAGNCKNAMEAYRKAGNWQEVLFCVKELKVEENEVKELYLDLAMELSEVKLFKESAIIYLDYLKDVEECVKTLCRGKHFAEAYRISFLHNYIDLVNQIIKPEVIEQGNLMKLYIANLNETFVKQKNRLEVVRKQKKQAISDVNEFDDLYSETNTIITQSNATSRITSRTYRSAKNKRKHERKLFSLKEGSPYEDLALVTSLYNMACSSNGLKSEVKELNKVLLKIKQYETAEMLQKILSDYLKTIEMSKSEIWIPELLNNKCSYGPELTTNEISAMFLKSENVAPVSLNLKYAIPPETQDNVKWQLEILNP